MTFKGALKLSKQKSRGPRAGQCGATLGETLGLPVLAPVAPRGEAGCGLGGVPGAEASAGPVGSWGALLTPSHLWGPGLRGARPRAVEVAWRMLTMNLTVGTEQGKGEA